MSEISTSSNSEAGSCTVYFDGGCPLCSREIAHYRQLSGAQEISWVDAASCTDATLVPGINRSDLLKRFHVQEADGTIVSGAAAFVAIWRRLPAFSWLAALASHPSAMAVLDTGYELFLSVRRWWRSPSDGLPSNPDRRVDAPPVSPCGPSAILDHAEVADGRPARELR